MPHVSDESVARAEARWFILRLIGLFVVLVAGFILLLSMKGEPSSRFPRAKLPDGTWIVARSVTVGTRHSIEIPLPLDYQLRQWRPSYQEGHTTQSDRMVIWLTRENDRGEMLDLDCFYRCELLLSDDFRTSPNSYHKQEQRANSNTGSGVGGNGYEDAKPAGAKAKQVLVALVRCELPLVRPRDSAMRLAIYDGTKQPVAQMELPYPALPNPPSEDWKMETLPVTKSDGNLTITLKDVKFRQHQSHSGLSITPQLEFVHDGTPSTTWNAATEVLDQLGNTSRAWHCDLSPLEAVWKLRMSLAQTPNGRFLPEETRTLKLMPITPDKEIAIVSESYTVNGSTLKVIGLGGKGPLEFELPDSSSQFKTNAYQVGMRGGGMSSSCSGNRCDVTFSSGQPFLVTEDTTSATGNQIQLVIRDQSGANLSQSGASSVEGKMFWFFEPNPTSTDVEVEVIVQKPRHAEFLIAPPTPDQIQTQ